MLVKLSYTLGISLSILVLVSCAKKTETIIENNIYTDKFTIADNQIGELINSLDSPKVSTSKKQEILCSRLPDVYKNRYMPALLKLSPHVYTEDKLLKDLESTTSFYKKSLAIKCR
ncbi:hypothetical protein [Acinetobacter seifertii]|uniref:hypothetical protein n=1 Tax=Acinetobacter seifertii TaxID=1530123 RepID=UPI00083A5924|nr:hypothetical protein [Acinetobacter seifertii]OCZ58471.1 hypothetical protein A7P21_15385 [Acinetobacter seifertii]